jgi:hypothetical protein
VRAMAGRNNVPLAGTALAEEAASAGRTTVTCGDYALTAKAALEAAGYDVHIEQTCLVPYGYNCHVLVSVAHAGRYELADPTFGLIPLGEDPTSGVTLAEMRDFTRSLNFTAVSYEFVSPEADQWVRDYYVDYPLLFANTYVNGQPEQPLETDVPDKYFQPLGVASAQGYYAVSCAVGQSNAMVVADGKEASWPCDGVYGVTAIHWAGDIEPSDGSVVVQPLRFKF